MKHVILIVVLATIFPEVSAQKPEVIYHVFQRSFFDSNGDGHGDLSGMEQKLDYLQELGATSILLMPLYQSDFYHNYFATDFEKIDPEFGTMDDYLSLVKAVHKRGMKIYQDVEMQYVTQGHPWFSDSYGNPESEFSKYVYYDDTLNAKPWYFWGVEEFTIYDDTRHKIAVVNMGSAEVRDYTADLLSFWLDPNGDGNFEDGVDGFRLDHMMDDLDNAGKLTNLFATFWTPVLSRLKTVNPEVRIIAEQANWASYGYEYFDRAVVDRVFAFRLKFAIESFDKKQILAAADSTFNYLPNDKNQIVFIENHDTKRFASRVNRSVDRMKAGAALNLLLGGIPLIYYGQEIGMPGEQLRGMTDGNDIPIREAFEWYKAAEGPGMCFWYRGSGEWWDNSNVKADDGISLAEQRADTNSLWHFYRSMIGLRTRHPALASGQYQPVANNNDKVLSFLRAGDKSRMLVVVNLSDTPQSVSIDGVPRRNKQVFGEARLTTANSVFALELAPYATSVFQLR